jgi:hypothetical protein
MLPSIKVPNPRPNRNRPRPISPSDSALTTGLTFNPNGTYVANPFPTTAQNGMQGGFGSGLPTTSPIPQVTMPSTVPGYIPSVMQPPVSVTFPGVGTQNTYTVQPPVPTVSTNPRPPAHGQGSFTQQAAMEGVLSRLDMGDMSVISQIPKADLEAMGLADLAATIGGGTGENTDFQKTEAFKYNQANQIPLMAQKRWDEKKRKFISVGEWMRQERKKYNRKGKYVGDKAANRKRAQQQAAAEQPASDGEYHGSIQQIGVVNFNTATG